MPKTFKQEAKEFLADVPAEFVFRAQDGCIMKNMKELADELDAMTEVTYAFHVNHEKNDFYNWVKDIIKDDRLAKDLKEAPNRAQAAKRAASRVTLLKKRMTG
ncbi:MAG: hypothetical protein PHR56_05820 [Dehalococcoidales bacterium]|nr:hypothetical protein [Dehalococcoidales bacterium]